MLRLLPACSTILFCLAAPVHAEPLASRFGVPPDPKSFPQATAKEALASVVKAVELKRFDYLLAHLSDPEWVETRLETSAGGFKELVQETAEKFDGPSVKLLQKFLKDGEYETLDASATVRLKSNKDRVVRLKKHDKRWHFQNAYRP